MAPTFYHRVPMPDLKEHDWEDKKPRLWRCLVLGAFIVLLAMFIALVYFMVQVFSPACRDGLRMQEQCRNDTQSLQQSLKSTQRALGEAQAQLANYNRTVETLMATLAKKEKEHQQKMQAKEEEHQREIQKLREQLQEAVAQLDSKSGGSEDRGPGASAGTSDSSSHVTLSAWVEAGLILLWSLGFL